MTTHGNTYGECANRGASRLVPSGEWDGSVWSDHVLPKQDLAGSSVTPSSGFGGFGCVWLLKSNSRGYPVYECLRSGSCSVAPQRPHLSRRGTGPQTWPLRSSRPIPPLDVRTLRCCEKGSMGQCKVTRYSVKCGSVSRANAGTAHIPFVQVTEHCCTVYDLSLVCLCPLVWVSGSTHPRIQHTEVIVYGHRTQGEGLIGLVIMML